MSRARRLLALGVSLCVLAGAFAVSPLYVAGVALILIAGAAAVTVRIGAARARIGLELSADTVEEGAHVTITVRAEGWPAACGRPLLRAAPATPWRAVPPRGESLALRVAPPRRGEFTIGPAVLRFADPFGICVRERASAPSRLLVLPRLERVRREDLERLVGLGRSAPQHDGGTGVGGLRAYRPGAPASRIHWLSVARRGTLLERRFEEDGEEAALTIALDTRAPASVEALDAAVRAAASLCVGLAGLGGCALLLPGWAAIHPIRADLASWSVVHAGLACAAGGQELDWMALSRARLVVLVSARRAPARMIEPGIGCTVSPFASERPALFHVAGCAVQAAGAAARHVA